MPQVTADDDRLIDLAIQTLLKGDASEPEDLADRKRALAQTIIDSGIVEKWHEVQAEVVGGGGTSASLGMMLARPRHRLVYSIKPSNFLRDPILSTSATTIAIFGAYYAQYSLVNLPVSFPGFLISLIFTVLRSIAHPVSYGEAALLHHMNQIQDQNGLIQISSLKDAGNVLVEKYDYAKGCNSNEIESLIQSLISWKAIEAIPKGGYRVRETIPFGFGPSEYIS